MGSDIAQNNIGSQCLSVPSRTHGNAFRLFSYSLRIDISLNNIYDFCIRQKASKDFHYEGVKEDKTNIYNKLIRYYVSKDGEKLYKIKNPTCQTNAPERSQIEAGKWLCTVCNYLPKETKVEDCNIDYEYYITKTEDIIVKIDKHYKRTQFKQEQQLSLW